jgi:uncharacterized membrane protein YhiD involved in acid resistance
MPLGVFSRAAGTRTLKVTVALTATLTLTITMNSRRNTAKAFPSTLSAAVVAGLGAVGAALKARCSVFG